MNELRAVIRELLVEELAKIEGGAVGATRAERVRLRTDAELAAFVKRLLELARDDQCRADIEAGRLRFRLAEAASPASPSSAAISPGTAPRFAQGLVSEKDVARLAQGVSEIVAEKLTRFTPLARDELRRRGIRIQVEDDKGTAT